MKNYYDLLGIERDSTIEQIKIAYRKLSMKFHPDKNSGEIYFSDMFRQVNEAYQVLSDPIARRNYDVKLSEFENPEKAAKNVYNDAQRKLREQLFQEKVRLQAEAKRELEAEREKLRSENKRVEHIHSHVHNYVVERVTPTFDSKASNLRSNIARWHKFRNILFVLNLILGIALFSAKSHKKTESKLFNARVNSRNGLRLRKSPSSTAETVSMISYYEIVSVLRTDGPSNVFRNTSQNWYFIEYHGKTGWIWGGYLTKQL